MEDLGEWDIVVVGGGLVGMAAGYGMAREGAKVLILDASDTSYRASRGNFGLVWAQSKGAGCRDYALWTRKAVRTWPEFERDIQASAGVKVHYQSGLGIHLCLGSEELEKRTSMIEQINKLDLPDNDTHMIDRKTVKSILPGIGERVAGASVSSYDGACQPLSLYRGLCLAAQSEGAKLVSNAKVETINPLAGGYSVISNTAKAWGVRILIAAGLSTNDLARQFGIPKIVQAQKGQILVTERARQMMPAITSSIRQTADGTILIGDTKEDELDDHSSGPGIARLARRAAALLPEISGLRVVRSWAALRVLTPDGHPVYDESPTHPGIFVAATHSGVTLASVHSGVLARWIMGGQRPPEFASFSVQRFN
ncbi:NAD(P)/FAD-dependent oxidoreductase [Kordiimonas sp.]|uniref:NAD(P)/FAD-dependent oxidoreductase n=1 Tax=Kordiimonas sp. TaxID=1970157 RepID=UPI003A934399